MSFAIALTDEQWELVADLFDPPSRRGAPAVTPRRQMVEAILFIARAGCQRRYLPDRYPLWEAVWQQWRRWRENGVWARAIRVVGLPHVGLRRWVAPQGVRHPPVVGLCADRVEDAAQRGSGEELPGMAGGVVHRPQAAI
jgi:transposase